MEKADDVDAGEEKVDNSKLEVDDEAAPPKDEEGESDLSPSKDGKEKKVNTEDESINIDPEKDQEVQPHSPSAFSSLQKPLPEGVDVDNLFSDSDTPFSDEENIKEPLVNRSLEQQRLDPVTWQEYELGKQQANLQMKVLYEGAPPLKPPPKRPRLNYEPASDDEYGSSDDDDDKYMLDFTVKRERSPELFGPEPNAEEVKTPVIKTPAVYTPPVIDPSAYSDMDRRCEQCNKLYFVKLINKYIEPEPGDLSCKLCVHTHLTVKAVVKIRKDKRKAKETAARRREEIKSHMKFTKVMKKILKRKRKPKRIKPTYWGEDVNRRAGDLVVLEPDRLYYKTEVILRCSMCNDDFYMKDGPIRQTLPPICYSCSRGCPFEPTSCHAIPDEIPFF